MNLVKIDPTEFGIEQKEAQKMTTGLKPHLEERELLIKEYEQVKDLEITEENLPVFRDLRLKFQKNRTQGIMKWHKSAKEVALRTGQLLDAIKKREIEINQTHEEFLEKGEKHFELLEKQRIQQLQKEREAQISQYVEDADKMDLGNMQDDVWEAFYSVKKKNYLDQKEAEKKAEEERKELERKQELLRQRKDNIIDNQISEFIEWSDLTIDTTEDDFEKMVLDGIKKRKAHLEEQERIRKENERLERERKEAEEKRAKEEAERKEKEEAERKVREEKERKEREAYEAKLRAEQEAREKAEKAAKEREAKLKAEIEAKKKAEREEQERIESQRQAELKKGDSDKVKDLIADLENLKTKYTFESKENQKMYSEVGQLLSKVVNHVNK